MDEKDMPENDASDKSSSSMLNEHGSQSHQNNGQHSQTSRYGGGAVSTHDYAVARNGDGDNGSQKTGTRQTVEHQPTIPRASRVVAIAEGILALATLGTSVITAFQLISMNSQLEQMKIANEFTQKAIDTANRQANAAEDANNIAKSALLSDRAWIGLANSSIMIDATTPSKSIIFLQYQNHGKSPARNVNMDNQIKFAFGNGFGDLESNLATQFARSCMTMGASARGSLIYPNTSNSSMQTQINFDPSTDMSDIISSKKIIFVLSCVGYETNGSIKHTSSCRIYKHGVTNPNSLTYCDDGDSAE